MDALNAGSTARDRGIGKAFGFANPFRVGGAATCSGGVLGGVAGSPLDLNLANAITCAGSTLGGGQVINFEARVPVLGFNVPEALILRSNGESTLPRRTVWSDTAPVEGLALQRFLHVVQVDRHEFDGSRKHCGFR